MMAAVSIAWAFLKSPIGKWLLAVLGALAILFTLYNWVHGDGEKVGAVRVQAQIDKPVSGWRAQLGTCQLSNDQLTKAQAAQTKAINDKSAADRQRLADAGSEVAKALPQGHAATGRIAVVNQPIDIAATQPAGETCVIPNAEASRIREIGRRLTQP